MKKTLLASAAVALALTGAAGAQEVKIGVILGFTGPIESLTPDMAASAELAMKEASDAGTLLGGKVLVPVRADSTCVDSAAAVAAAERLVTSEKVAAIYGPDCSGVTMAVTANVSVPNGVVTISPSATSPALSTIEDKGYFFRTAPSDARQGQVLADIVKERGIKSVAVTYTNNDYGKGLADAFVAAFTAAGGEVPIVSAHEDGKGDYSAEVGALAAAGADALAVFGYVDQGGKGVIQAALDTGAFDTFILGDGMIGDSLTQTFGSALDGSFGTAPGSAGDNFAKFDKMAKANGIMGDGPYRGESYDAAALIALAMQAAGSDDRAAIQSKIIEVANAPGEPIGPGELAKALDILAKGGDVDYVGATNVELIGPGEAAGSYRELEVKGGKFTTVRVR
ncbi:ABC transporter substrate-binding protein [Oceanicella actignis]|uniref:Branched-chain amino acid transport system substrate-binding protein n=1 Tax=Oceanicella actignis TaxID=1189325 RepID=A0A1M7TGT3_9RHOB|nr:ABC transporter substrate-binding protein [Oceanicella actignis]TYO88478.1 amino acid/amide ABC transporter substrate-binding protein (HAAT family) [Oceanicella actignis]SET59515.1 amino acid/amide ABC transporter substrate-binding protein, HAAT family [Oceanicella actignis]SHN69979.1 branched-chain amino acid transport system substrate-binding protein [Oceanicella actignis]